MPTRAKDFVKKSSTGFPYLKESPSRKLRYRWQELTKSSTPQLLPVGRSAQTLPWMYGMDQLNPSSISAYKAGLAVVDTPDSALL